MSKTLETIAVTAALVFALIVATDEPAQCTTDSECAAQCNPADASCDGGPQD